jgi:hypothetical protein
MTRRKGEITRARLRRRWPHHVALSAETVRGLAKPEDAEALCQRFGGMSDADSLFDRSTGKIVRRSVPGRDRSNLSPGTKLIWQIATGHVSGESLFSTLLSGNLAAQLKRPIYRLSSFGRTTWPRRAIPRLD